MNQKEFNDRIDKVHVTWNCRFHPFNWWHEIGCPHKEWTKEELLDALIFKKRFEKFRLEQDGLSGIILNNNKMEDTNTSTPKELTYGEKAVGITFNPSNNELVDIIKKQYAYIIDNIHTLRDEGKSEKNRLISIAITQAQDAQMWAVKAITWKD